jgi:hypothetical protein
LSLVFVVCCVGSGLYVELIAPSEEFYRVCVIVCDLETSTMRPELLAAPQEESTT